MKYLPEEFRELESEAYKLHEKIMKSTTMHIKDIMSVSLRDVRKLLAALNDALGEVDKAHAALDDSNLNIPGNTLANRITLFRKKVALEIDTLKAELKARKG